MNHKQIMPFSPFREILKATVVSFDRNAEKTNPTTTIFKLIFPFPHTYTTNDISLFSL